jgi:hypothetical protein
LCVWPAFGRRRTAPPTSVAPGDPKVHLPEGALPCSIGFAYQAADAGHPRAGRASSPPSKETSPSGLFLTRLHAANAPIGRASPGESTATPHLYRN